MQIVLKAGRDEVDLDVVVHHPGATVADLAAKLAPSSDEAGQGLLVDGRLVPPDHLLSAARLHQGAVVSLPGDGEATRDVPRPRPPPPYALAVIGGLVAGPAWPLRKRNTHVGRGNDNDVLIDDPTVSWDHCTVTAERGGDIEISDRCSRNGTWVGEQAIFGPTAVNTGVPIRLGAVRVAVEPSSAGDDLPAVYLEPRSTSAGAVHLNRPPRQADPPPAEPIVAPAAPPSAPARVPLSIVALVAPLAFAALMVVVLDRLIFALFALLSPVMILGNWIESRRRERRTSRSGGRQFAADLVTFRAALEDRRQAERERRWRATPHPAELLRQARAPSVRLWERRPEHGDFLQLQVGIGSVPWSPPVTTGGGKVSPEVSETIAAAGFLREVPVAVDLTAGSVVGIAGDRRAALALARSLVLQATTLSGPADVRVAVFTEPDRTVDWEWAKWLPHTLAAAGAPLERLLAPDDQTGEALIRVLVGAGPPRSASRGAGLDAVTLVVVDAEGWIEDAAGRALLRGEGGPTSAIVLADATHRLPAMCTAVLELRDVHGEVQLRHPDKADVVDGILAAGVTASIARQWARELARFEDLEVAVAGPGLVDTVSLASILDFDPFDPECVAARWREDALNRRPVTPIGVTRDGVLRIDLADDGPHGLVVGTTGSGKSEVLRTLIAGLAVTLDPTNINFLLFDYKGGRAFDQCARLPHVVGLVTDLDEQLGQRALRTLEAEIRHRERVLASADATDLDDYFEMARDATRRLEPLPRLLVVVDEFATLSAELPRFVDSLVDVAQRGRGLGIHLLLGTQRPSGAVSASIKANTALRIALRVETEGDSVEAVGTREAAFIPKGRPGRGFARLRTGKPTPFQAAQVSGVAASPGTVVEVRPFRFGPGLPTGAETAGDGRGSSSKGLPRLVTAVNAAFATTGLEHPRRLWADAAPAEAPRETIGLPDLLGLDDVASLNPNQFWRDRPTHDRLRVPIGLTADGQPLHLDLKESALVGMGPHGLIVGATGSGKSELLRTLVSALAITHPPELLSFVLVDFKGGATFSGMADLPHVAGLITNLEEDQASVDRMRDALFGELRRRQAMLQSAGDLASIGEYEELRTTVPALEPMPSLLVIVDEFAELLAADPEFIDLFVSIGRLGRSLGMHLLLSSQRLEEGRLRGLESHIRYRIGLRTFSAQESRTVLGVPDAYELPAEPGVGYLKVDTTVFTRFKAASISAPYRPTGHQRRGRRKASGPSRNMLQVIVPRLAEAAPRVHQVWLPPLEPFVTLDQLLPDLNVDAERGLVASDWRGVGSLVVPLGIVDLPAEQKRGILTFDASGSAGNLALVGAPQTGKSTALKTLVAAFALTHTPTEVQLYCIDYGGGGLAALEGLPHVGGVASRLEPDKVRRVVAEVDGVMGRREALFKERGIDSVNSLRALRRAGDLPDEQFGDVFLVVDNWPALRLAFEDLEPTVVDLAARGLGYGVHVMLTANRWMEVRANLRDSLGARLELRLSDPADSSIDRRAAENVAIGTPGRGLTPRKLHFQSALPRIDGQADIGGLQRATADMVARAAKSWSGPVAPGIRLLPSLVGVEELPPPGADSGTGVPVGWTETDPLPLYLDLTTGEPHFLVFGDGESGKTAFLRTFVTGLCGRNDATDVRVAFIDYRRTLLEVIGPDHLGFYAGAAQPAGAGVKKLCEVLAKRQPGPDVSAAQLRKRSWWHGPELYLVVDDYELVAAAPNPLAPLMEFLPQGHDLGFHLILARRVAGAQRGILEPVLQRVRELGSPGLILSGDRGEGPLMGTHRAAPLPPGRGLLVRRKEKPVLVQVAWTPEPAEPAHPAEPSPTVADSP